MVVLHDLLLFINHRRYKNVKMRHIEGNPDEVRERKRERERESRTHHLLQMLHMSWTMLRLARSLSWVFFSICSTISSGLNPWMRVTCQKTTFFFLSLSLFLILPSWAEGWRNRNQTRASM